MTVFGCKKDRVRAVTSNATQSTIMETEEATRPKQPTSPCPEADTLRQITAILSTSRSGSSEQSQAVQSPLSNSKSRETDPSVSALSTTRRADSWGGGGRMVASPPFRNTMVVRSRSGKSAVQGRDVAVDYSIGKVLWEGFGTTLYACTHRLSGKEFACKMISKAGPNSLGNEQRAEREVRALLALSGQEGVAQLVAVYEDDTALYIVMEICTGDSVYNCMCSDTRGGVQKEGQQREEVVMTLFRGMMKSVQQCHKQFVSHRDIKLSHFMLSSPDPNASVKLIDFGSSTVFTQGSRMRPQHGDPAYMAPEAASELYAPQCDMWSCGVCLYILLSDRHPFPQDGGGQVILLGGMGPLDLETYPWPLISEDAKRLVSHMLQWNPCQRATIKDVLGHPWLQARIWDGDIAKQPSERQLGYVLLPRLRQFGALSLFQKLVMMVASSMVGEEDNDERKRLFEMLDTDGDGRVGFRELFTGVRRFRKSGEPLTSKRALHAVAIDGSDLMTRAQFMAATLRLRKERWEELLPKIFAHFDRGEKGVLSVWDIQRVLTECGIVDPLLVSAMMATADSNKDGKLDYAEFSTMMRIVIEPWR